MQEIAEGMWTHRSDVTRLVDKLVKAGLVARKRGIEDRRIVWVELTDNGHRILDEILGPSLALHKTQFSHLGKAKKKMLINLLKEARQPGWFERKK